MSCILNKHIFKANTILTRKNISFTNQLNFKVTFDPLKTCNVQPKNMNSSEDKLIVLLIPLTYFSTHSNFSRLKQDCFSTIN